MRLLSALCPLQSQQPDTIRDAIYVAVNFSGRQAIDFQTFAAQVSIAVSIFCDLRGFTVKSAIDLDNQSRLEAVKVEDIGAKRVLALEDQSVVQTSFQAFPQQPFRPGQGLAHLPGERGFAFCCIGHK